MPLVSDVTLVVSCVYPAEAVFPISVCELRTEMALPALIAKGRAILTVLPDFGATLPVPSVVHAALRPDGKVITVQYPFSVIRDTESFAQDNEVVDSYATCCFCTNSHVDGRVAEKP